MGLEYKCNVFFSHSKREKTVVSVPSLFLDAPSKAPRRNSFMETGMHNGDISEKLRAAF